MSSDESNSWIFEHRSEYVVAKRGVSGGLAGVIAKSFVAPFSRVTILMQCQSMRPHKFEAHAPTTRLMESLTKIIREEGGYRALWKGNGAAVFHRFPYVGVTFSCLELFKSRCKGTCSPRLEMILSSIGAAGVAVIAAYPLDLVKTRLTTQTKTVYYKGIADCIGRIIRDEGHRGLYRGLVPTLCSAVPNVTLNLFIYGQLKEQVLHRRELDAASQPFSTLGMGATAGFISSTLLFPIDLVRRQMQMEGLHGRPRVYKNAPDAARQIFLLGVRNADGKTAIRRVMGGMLEFYRGLAPELVKVIPYAAVQFLVFETLMHKTWPGEAQLMRRQSYVANLK